MATTFIKADLPAFSLQMSNFSIKLSGYKITLDLTDNEITTAKNDASALHWIVLGLKGAEDYHRQWTAYKDMVRFSRGGEVNTMPGAITLEAAPPAVPPGIQKRFGSLVARIKKHPSYTDAIGKDLDIIAAQNVADNKNARPVVKISITSGGHPTLLWKKGRYDGVEIWKDSGKGFEKLDKDFVPDFTDKSALPAAGTTSLWKYKMIYLLKDEQIGNWSDEISVTVAGVV